MTGGRPRKISSRLLACRRLRHTEGRADRQPPGAAAMVRVAWCFLLVAALAGSCCALLVAGEPGAGIQEPASKPALHQRIDQLVEAASIGPLAPVCSDADFVRRIYL